MSDYVYIMNECKKAHYGKWEEDAVEACVVRLPKLSRQELVHLLNSRWLGKSDELRKEIVKVLFKEQIEEHQRKISSSSIDELGAMLIEKGGNNVKWARMELKRRYKDANHNDQMLIISYFKRGTAKQDVKWGEVRAKWQQRGYAEPPRFF